MNSPRTLSKLGQIRENPDEWQLCMSDLVLTRALNLLNDVTDRIDSLAYSMSEF